MLSRWILFWQFTMLHATFITLNDVNVWLVGTSPTQHILISYEILSDSIVKCTIDGTDPTFTINDTNLDSAQNETFVSFNATSAGVNFVMCKTETLSSNTARIIVFENPSADVCVTNNIPYAATSFNIKLGLPAIEDYNIMCSCTSSFPTVQILKDTTSTIITYSNTCTLDSCSCDLQCSVGNYMLPAISAIFGGSTFFRLYSKSFFTSLTMTSMGNFLVYSYPLNKTISSIKCCLATAVMTNFHIHSINCTNVSEFSISGNSSNGYHIGQVYSHPNATSGLYGIKCSSGSYSTEFTFQFSNTKPSTLMSEAVDYGGLVVASCPCDLTESFCDLRCCCDTDCIKKQLDSFDYCITGPEGGDHSVQIPLNCSNLSNSLAPWERILCFASTTSPYLGTYFSLQNYSTLVPENTVEGSIVVGLSDTWTGLAGSPIIIHSPGVGHGILTLPGNMGHSCTVTSPVRYLLDSTSACVVKKTDCKVGSLLNPRSYLTPVEETLNPCHWFSDVKSSGKFSDKADLKVYYTLNNVPVDHLLTNILISTDCSYAVTSVLYTFLWSSTGIKSVTANIELENLLLLTKDVYISYKTVFIMSNDPTPTLAGYNTYSSLLYADNSIGSLTDVYEGVRIPQYGACNVSAYNKVEFGVGSIGLCYVTVTKDCAEIQLTLTAMLNNFTNTSDHVGVNLASVTTDLSGWVKVLNVVNDNVTDDCVNIPISVTINIFTKPNKVSGYDIVNITRTFYTSSLLISEQQSDVIVTVSVSYTNVDIVREQCLLCLERLFVDVRDGNVVINTVFLCLIGLLYFVLPIKYVY